MVETGVYETITEPGGRDQDDSCGGLPRMILRDYFAGQALAGIGHWSEIISNMGMGSKESAPYTQAAALLVFEIADAMLAERAKRIDPLASPASVSEKEEA